MREGVRLKLRSRMRAGVTLIILLLRVTLTPSLTVGLPILPFYFCPVSIGAFRLSEA